MLTLDDENIFLRASQNENVIIITKDEDFSLLLTRYGAPPKVIWITIGNCTTDALKSNILSKFSETIEALRSVDLVEIAY